MTAQRIRRKRRRIRREIKYGLVALLSIILIILVFTVVIPLIDQMRLSSMGYSRVSAKNIVSQKLTKTALSRDYSSAFDVNMNNNIIVGDNLELYYVTTEINDDAILLYDRLQELGYKSEDVLKAFASLHFKEITPLLVFNNVDDIDIYIADVINNRDSETFTLNNIYTIHYEDIKQIADPTALDTLVNKYNQMASTYLPEVVDMSLQYASSGQSLREDAYESFITMVKAMKTDGLSGIYVFSGYRSYETQSNIYERYVTSKGQEWADCYSARPGHSEHQLGLAADVAAVSGSSNGFDATEEYAWLAENSYKYGWILRYPEDKEIITGYGYEPWHYRYLGEDLATKVAESGLTYDEYCVLYQIVSAE